MYLNVQTIYIIYIVQISLKEAEFLQKILPGYYMNLHQNPRTLLPKFFGMFTYQVLIGLWLPLCVYQLFSGYAKEYSTGGYE